MSQSYNTKATFYRQDIQLAACEITGISITIGIPHLPKVLDYINPLASVSNAMDIAKLGYLEHKKLSNDILAGILLSILSHHELIGDKLSATQRNIYLQVCHPYYLSQALTFFSKISRKQASKLPHISFASEEGYSSTLDVLKNYIKVCTSILYPENNFIMPDNESVYIFKSKGKTIVPKITSEDKQTFKASITSLYMEALISKKFYDLLLIASQKDNLLNIEENMRKKIIEKLASLSSIEAQKVIAIIKKANKKEEDIGSAMQDEVPRKPMSLADIIAKKLGKQEEQKEIETVSLEEVEELISMEEAEEEGEDDDF